MFVSFECLFTVICFSVFVFRLHNSFHQNLMSCATDSHHYCYLLYLIVSNCIVTWQYNMYFVLIWILLIYYTLISNAVYKGNECLQECPPGFSVVGLGPTSDGSALQQMLLDANPFKDIFEPRCAGNLLEYLHLQGIYYTFGDGILNRTSATETLHTAHKIAQVSYHDKVRSYFYVFRS